MMLCGDNSSKSLLLISAALLSTDVPFPLPGRRYPAQKGAIGDHASTLCSPCPAFLFRERDHDGAAVCEAQFPAKIRHQIFRSCYTIILPVKSLLIAETRISKVNEFVLFNDILCCNRLLLIKMKRNQLFILCP